jgi:hypothetical protein
VAGEEFRVDFPYTKLESVSFGMMSFQKTDANGKAFFAKLPPGNMELTQVYVQKIGSATAMVNGKKHPVEIPAGSAAKIIVEAGKLVFVPQAAFSKSP